MELKRVVTKECLGCGGEFEEWEDGLGVCPDCRDNASDLETLLEMTEEGS